jgi:hypothetical protein
VTSLTPGLGSVSDFFDLNNTTGTPQTQQNVRLLFRLVS